jgi:gliding motility-associated-like protein
MKKTYYLLLLLILSGQTFSQQFSCGMPLAPNAAEKLKEETNVTWSEQEEKRTLFSSQFVDERGNTKGVFSKKPINYLNKNGKLMPINPSLKPSKLGSWRADEQQFPTALFADGSYSVSLDELGATMYLGKNRSINNVSYKQIHLNSEQVHLTGCNIALGSFTQQLLFMEDRVKSNLIVSEPVNLGESQYFITTERIELPDGYELQYAPHPVTGLEDITIRGARGTLFIDGMAYGADIQVINSKTKAICGTIFAPIAYDAAIKSCKGLIQVKRLSIENEYELTVAVSTEWMNAAERTYPVTIDPLVGGPTTTWAGSYMNSCLSPAYNVDSIQATIPGGVTVTGVYVTASFYADPWSAATMSQGVMYFSGPCGSSQTFTVTGPTAGTAGTAYLDSFNMMSPLICCLPESCSSTNFYVRFHLGRYNLGAGCNLTYIRYDPFTTLWPFQVVVYGRTPETYGSEWYATQTPQCSNDCEIEVRGYARYGVAPYTFTHPWTNDTVVTGTNTGCGAGSTNHLFNLTVPTCPLYCDSTFTVLNIPPPVITDACGTVITSIGFETLPIKPATNIDLVYDSVLCSGETTTINLTSCLANGTAYYFGEGQSGQGSFTVSPTTTDAPITLNYSAYAEGDGCTSDTSTFQLTVYSNPTAAYLVNPNPVVAGIEAAFQDQSTSPASTIQQWVWTLDDSVISLTPQWNNLYLTPANHVLCLAIQDAVGCVDTLCSPFVVVPAEVATPNVITPNNDGKNDILSFEYLEFYPENSLRILNRWGGVVFEQNGYANTWDGGALIDGVYFYVLTITEKNQTYSGFFHLIR